MIQGVTIRCPSDMRTTDETKTIATSHAQAGTETARARTAATALKRTRPASHVRGQPPSRKWNAHGRFPCSQGTSPGGSLPHRSAANVPQAHATIPASTAARARAGASSIPTSAAASAMRQSTASFTASAPAATSSAAA